MLMRFNCTTLFWMILHSFCWCQIPQFNNLAPFQRRAPCLTIPGQTFCENVPNYPRDLIQNAIRRVPFDVSKFFVDESIDESPRFAALVERKENLQEPNEKIAIYSEWAISSVGLMEETHQAKINPFQKM